jgi:nucleolar GTP-binding protein
MMNVADIILFILDPSEHCGYPMEVQLNLLDEVKGTIDVPLVVVANKSDLQVVDGYLSMSTENGEGVENVLAAILDHKPETVERKRSKSLDIRSPLVHDPEETESGYGSITENGEKVPKKRLHRKPRTPRAEISPSVPSPRGTQG